ncbi:MAG: hypothetical protein AAB152_03440 [Candidatus Coatesbacteria bacterium]
MRARPDDPWPRGEGHVILAVPGSREEDKGYHEPGGSLSPGVGTFGVSVWALDREGRPVATGEGMPLGDIVQRFVRAGSGNVPGIETVTPHFRACWTVERRGRWRLAVTPGTSAPPRLAIVVRSPGPAGGPVTSLVRDGRRLVVNGRWSVTVTPDPLAVAVGEEGREGWTHERAEALRWDGDAGWGYARIELGGRHESVVEIAGPAPDPEPELAGAPCRPVLRLDLPDAQFTACLEAQVAHLMMGLVGRETRPGDPTNYPLPWLRDGAHVLAALAGAGMLESAKVLAEKFASDDFFGGFGAEGDSPGLAIWALDEVSVRLRDQGFDRWLLPHVRRKAGWIVEMAHSLETINMPFSGPIVPLHRERPDLDVIAQPTRDGLVVGRMDNHYPLLFVNAVCYTALNRAARLADRVGEGADANRWRQEAGGIMNAWARCLDTDEARNERTYIFSLWPSGVAARVPAPFRRRLEERWDQVRTRELGFVGPRLWTYFDFAEAHQWLFLGEPDRARSTLRWYLDHQTSPGLFTWWEGDGEENTFHRWEDVRGWVTPKHVTPHYWTAAQALALQLDMLVHVAPGAQGPVLVIGAGVPSEWRERAHGVERLPTAAGDVDWRWESGRMRVRVRRGGKPAVRLGPAYPAGAKVEVEYTES